MGSSLDLKQLADELRTAYAERRIVPPPSARDAAFDLAGGYTVEAELMRQRVASGHKAVGLKVGYANKAMWRALKLETLVWAHMYDDTVQFASGNAVTLSIAKMTAPKIEPEIVLKVKEPVSGADASEVLGGVEWIALGFEIIDCVYPDWQFQPVDFIAGYGLHAGLIVGEPLPITAANISLLVEQLAKFRIRLLKNGELVEEGSGKNSLRSPALCLGETARVAPIGPGDLLSSGTLTTSMRIGAGDEWKAEVDGIGLQALALRVLNS
jgi:2-oxo-3-hexenedioate decarboxylase